MNSCLAYHRRTDDPFQLRHHLWLFNYLRPSIESRKCSAASPKFVCLENVYRSDRSLLFGQTAILGSEAMQAVSDKACRNSAYMSWGILVLYISWQTNMLSLSHSKRASKHNIWLWMWLWYSAWMTNFIRAVKSAVAPLHTLAIRPNLYVFIPMGQ